MWIVFFYTYCSKLIYSNECLWITSKFPQLLQKKQLFELCLSCIVCIVLQYVVLNFPEINKLFKNFVIWNTLSYQTNINRFTRHIAHANAQNITTIQLSWNCGLSGLNVAAITPDNRHCSVFEVTGYALEYNDI